MSNWTVPAFADCDPGVEPTEFMVLIAMAQFSKVTPSGLHIPVSVSDREQWGAQHGRVLAISPLAFTYAIWPEGAHKPQVGDVVFVGKYPGAEVIGRDEKKYHLVSDREIAGIIERAEAQAVEVLSDAA